MEELEHKWKHHHDNMSISKELREWVCTMSCHVCDVQGVQVNVIEAPGHQAHNAEARQDIKDEQGKFRLMEKGP